MGTVISKEMIKKYDVPGPRYTSYPTAPQWDSTVDAGIFAEKLDHFSQSAKTLSLYVHIPFCETLCTFCACMMAIRPKDEKYGDQYIDYLEKEIQLIRKHLTGRMSVKQLHWGGGTPTFLSEKQINRLFGLLDKNFNIDYSGEIAVEIDPRRAAKSKIKTLRTLGFNRISLGVQDFDPNVQEAVNRIQPFELVRGVTDWCREFGFQSVNYDLIYGLPRQTRNSFSKTMDRVLELKPDRIALYSFAYLPWMKKHQTKIIPDDLPSNNEKLDIFFDARERFLHNGYQAIAMDHFALHDDELTKAFNRKTLYRNFMGYTTKPADEYLGLGVSSIGFLENTFFQNEKTIPEYYRTLDQGILPISRGKELSDDDRIRQWVIRSLMCFFRVDKRHFFEEFHVFFDDYFLDESEHLVICQKDGLLRNDHFEISVSDLGKIFIRNICMGFDKYLKSGRQKKFSKTI